MAHMHEEPRRRRSIRLKGYDYSQAGAYFVTIVTQGRLCVFGEVVGEQMRLNEAGTMVRQTWEALPHRFEGIAVDAFVVMPNHIHGIITINPPDADQPVGVPLVGTPNATHATNAPHHPDRATTRVAPTDTPNAAHATNAPHHHDRATTRVAPTGTPNATHATKAPHHPDRATTKVAPADTPNATHTTNAPHHPDRPTTRVAPTDTPNAAHTTNAPHGPARATTRVAPTGTPNATHTTLGDVVGAYKSLTTVEYASGVRTLNWPPFERRLWQRNYYEHIVRDDESLKLIRQYILDNPAQWAFDRENPAALRPQDAPP